jgi:hypothetical protein
VDSTVETDATVGAEAAGKADPLPKPRRRPPASSLANLRPWRKGQSGNPGGLRNRAIVSKLAARHTRAAVDTLAKLLENGDPVVRHKAAIALIHEAFGAPPTSQTVVNPTQVNINQTIGNVGAGLSPEATYRLMLEGVIPATGDHPAFQLEHQTP